jgi:hypothetical protein
MILSKKDIVLPLSCEKRNNRYNMLNTKDALKRPTQILPSPNVPLE